jgi:hypothetical protein
MCDVKILARPITPRRAREKIEIRCRRLRGCNDATRHARKEKSVVDEPQC